MHGMALTDKVSQDAIPVGAQLFVQQRLSTHHVAHICETVVPFLVRNIRVLHLTSQPLPAATAAPTSRRPFWGRSDRDADLALPRFDQEFNGIRVGPTVQEAPDGFCMRGEARYVTGPATADLGRVAIKPGYLPTGTVIDQQLSAVECRGSVRTARIEYVFPGADGRSGGPLSIDKFFAAGPALRSSLVAAERWYGTNLKGRPTAVGRPIYDEGFGPSLLVIWDDGVLIIVRASELPLAELLAIGAGLVE